MIGVNVVGGVALILFGIRLLRKGLQRLLGRHLQGALERTTESRLRAFFTGMGMAAVAPTSVGMAAIAVQLMHLARLSARRMFGLILGANVGITAGVQLIAFQLDELAPLFIAVGVLLFQGFSKEICRGIGQCLLGIGMIFLAMSRISQGAEAVPEEGDLIRMLGILGDEPFLLALVAAVLTLLMQSTTAVIGLGIGLTALPGDFTTLGVLVPVVLGADLGSGFISLIAGWATVEGRRLGMGNVILKGGLALVALFGTSTLISWVGHLPGDLARQVAHLHTGFNLVVALIGLPLVSLLYAALERIVPHAPGSSTYSKGPKSFLDPHALHNPWIALTNATREAQAMADFVKTMLQQYWEAQGKVDLNLAREIQKLDDEIDQRNNAIKEYLHRINDEELTREAIWLQGIVLNFSRELEAIGDIIDKNLCDDLLHHPGELQHNPAADQAELEQLFYWVSERLDIAVSLLLTHDSELASDLLQGKKRLNEWCREMQARHYQRLRQSEDRPIEASSCWLDTLNHLRRINSHATGIAYDFLSPSGAAVTSENDRSQPSS